MKTALILLAASIPALAQQNFDFKLLDKIGANATDSTNITLEGDTLKLATSFLGEDKNAFKNLTGVYVRSFEFAKTGQYKDADLAPVREYLKGLQWPRILDVKEDGEWTQIYMRALGDGRLGGFALISAEAKEVTVVFIAGVFNMSDLGKLSDDLGLPSAILNHDGNRSATHKKDQ
jgi:hypothetical protein